MLKLKSDNWNILIWSALFENNLGFGYEIILS
jgi:hypothetical protein